MSLPEWVSYAKPDWITAHDFEQIVLPWKDQNCNVLLGFPRDMRTLLDMYTINRVHYDSTTNTIKVLEVGSKSVDPVEEKVFGSERELPDWIQRKLAVLRVLEVDQLKYGGVAPDDVKDVGCRLDESTYWVYKVDDIR